MGECRWLVENVEVFAVSLFVAQVWKSSTNYGKINSIFCSDNLSLDNKC